MEKPPGSQETEREVAVVTGGNKGIGFEVCRQLAARGIQVVLASRDKSRGCEAVEKLKQSGHADYVVFHQLDVAASASIASLADFIRNQFGKLDILVNNAGILGAVMNPEALREATELAGYFPFGNQYNWDEIAPQNYELAEKCLKTNFYGTKAVTESLISHLQASDSPRIVNASSLLGLLQHIPNESVRSVFNDIEALTEEKIDEILKEFLNDFKEERLGSKGWPPYLSAYIVSKVSVNAYTRIIAKKHPNMRINAVTPGYVKTDITGNNGCLSADEGAAFVVRVALIDKEGPSGMFFNEKDASMSF